MTRVFNKSLFDIIQGGAKFPCPINEPFFAQLPWPWLFEVYSELEQERFVSFVVCLRYLFLCTYLQTLDDSKFPRYSRILIMN